MQFTSRNRNGVKDFLTRYEAYIVHVHGLTSYDQPARFRNIACPKKKPENTAIAVVSFNVHNFLLFSIDFEFRELEMC